MLARILAVALLAATAAGCQNPYQRYYQSAANNGTIPFAKVSGEPRIVASSGDPKTDVRHMFEDGYGLVGLSSFVGRATGPVGAIAQAKAVGAEIIVVSAKYLNTVSGAMPITVPTANTSHTSGTMNAIGPGGAGFGTFSGTTTTYGSETTYIPFTVDRYDQGALYFAPLERQGFGVMTDRLTDEQRRAAGTNQGQQVVAVRNGSPAFTADILPGDIILSVGGRAVFDLASLRSAVASVTDRQAEIVLFRNGARIVKQVTVPSGTW